MPASKASKSGPSSPAIGRFRRPSERSLPPLRPSPVSPRPDIPAGAGRTSEHHNDAHPFTAFNDNSGDESDYFSYRPQQEQSQPLDWNMIFPSQTQARKSLLIFGDRDSSPPCSTEPQSAKLPRASEQTDSESVSKHDRSAEDDVRKRRWRKPSLQFLRGPVSADSPTFKHAQVRSGGPPRRTLLIPEASYQPPPQSWSTFRMFPLDPPKASSHNRKISITASANESERTSQSLPATPAARLAKKDKQRLRRVPIPAFLDYPAHGKASGCDDSEGECTGRESDFTMSSSLLNPIEPNRRRSVLREGARHAQCRRKRGPGIITPSRRRAVYGERAMLEPERDGAH